LRRDLGLGLFSDRRVARTVRARAALRRWGPTWAGAYAVGAIRHPHRPALLDEHGAVDFATMEECAAALACGLAELGVDGAGTVAVMCANHRGFLYATLACSKLGANVCYLEPGTPRASAARALRREDAAVLICDEECSRRLAGHLPPRVRVIAYCDPRAVSGFPAMDELIARFEGASFDPPVAGERERGYVTVPTPAGPVPRRALPASLATRGAAASRIPFRRGETTVIAAPLCCGWGFLHFTLAARLGSTLVLPDLSDPVGVLAGIDRHAATALAVPPEMLKRMMNLPRETVDWYATGSLKVIAVRSGRLPFELAVPLLERFGDVMYSLRGPAVVSFDSGSLFAGSTPAGGVGVPRPARSRRVPVAGAGEEFRGAPV
jgi:acyl-CoA synthetase (AMP-forming)/AMP-acid ligase II